MPNQPKKQPPHTRGEERYIPSFHFAWEWMAEKDREALIELEEKYILLAQRAVNS
jgi:hypothetical protein